MTATTENGPTGRDASRRGDDLSLPSWTLQVAVALAGVVAGLLFVLLFLA